jgi:hypothetical protein
VRDVVKVELFDPPPGVKARRGAGKLDTRCRHALEEVLSTPAARLRRLTGEELEQSQREEVRVRVADPHPAEFS